MKKQKLPLYQFFNAISSHNYVLIKSPENLIDYEFGVDLDIFCYDLTSMVEIAASFLSDNLGRNSKVKINRRPYHVHVDYITRKNVELRFDIYEKLPAYKKVSLKSAFYETAIEHAQIKKVTSSGTSFEIRVPSLADDCILRYIEYHEYFESRPDKIKHIAYIEERISSGEISKAEILDKLHYYVSFPSVEYKEKSFVKKVSERVWYWVSLFDKGIKLLREKGVRYLFVAVLEHFRLKK